VTVTCTTEVIDPESDEPEDIPLGFAPVKVTSVTDRHKVLEDELNRIDDLLMRHDAMLPRVKHPDELCRMSYMTLKLLEARRKHLALPFGFAQRGPTKTDDYYDN
jgi:hypothetical protein